MNWDELREISRDPLCTIGAHTIRHFALARLAEDEARAEMSGSADRIERELGRRPLHFAYPYGDSRSASPREFRLARELGFATAVTTRKGLIFDAHEDHLTALPRLSLSGDYQKPRYVEVLLSGAPFLLFNGLRRVKTA
jgi:peptidoglycan/xylan/chitin deacetylase (PgdA/CDA1 family)